MAPFEPKRLSSFTVDGVRYQPQPGTLRVFWEDMPVEGVAGREPTAAEYVAFCARHVDELVFMHGVFGLTGEAAREWQQRTYGLSRGSGAPPRHEVVQFVDQDGVARKFPATKLDDFESTPPSTPMGRPPLDPG